MRPPSRPLVAALAAGLLLTACAVPVTVPYYDQECRVESRRMELEVVQVQAVHACRNEGCVAALIGAAAVLAGSTIISGTIVIAGNIAYWMERQKNCRPAAAPAAVPAAAPASAAR